MDTEILKLLKEVGSTGILALAILVICFKFLLPRYGERDKEKEKEQAAWRKTIDARLDHIEQKVSAEEVKTSVLWEVYGVTAIREANARGLVERKSPLKPSPLWETAIPCDVRERIEKVVAEAVATIPCLELAAVIWMRERKNLEPVIREHNLSQEAVLGTILVIVRLARGEEV